MYVRLNMYMYCIKCPSFSLSYLLSSSLFPSLCRIDLLGGSISIFFLILLFSAAPVPLPEAPPPPMWVG